VLVEAMAAGTPVLAVDADSSRDVLEQGGGVLVEGSLERFTAALHELLSDRSRLKTLSDQALQVAQRYDIPTAVDKLVGCIRTSHCLYFIKGKISPYSSTSFL
jgi:glycosyltransferase involved in cell wall biosynthesis